ncbi:MAG TPA: VWA domain-containing protein [Solirubrobacteraceae bacterium]|jgi:Ca-activated chloride channel family protein|nr:VWA domain-containing protein [Solirubrobacteraceae bacterium]
MSFAQPLFLVGLVLVPLALAAYLRHERVRGAAAASFASPALLAAVAPSTPGWRRHVPLAVYGVALTILLVALAKPQTTVAVPIERASIMLTTDFSGSMQATDVPPTRLAAARAAANRFLGEVPGSVRVGLVAFNQSARLVESPTTDRDVIRSALAALRPSGGTATGEALAVSLTALAAETDDAGARVPSAIVLLSDGKSVRGRSPSELALRAKELKIPIYTVALGTPTGTITVRNPDGTSETKPVPPDPFEMEKVAALSGGRAFTADNVQRLSTVYEQLGSRIGYRKEQRELTAAFSGGALSLLAAGALLSLHWFRRVV